MLSLLDVRLKQIEFKVLVTQDFFIRRKMELFHFYFLSDDYFIDFPDNKLMSNHEQDENGDHGRPCFLAVIDSSNNDIFWMVPISHRVDKYRPIYQKKTDEGKECDTLEFGDVLGFEKAFLIQNMCPATSKYIQKEYENQGIPVRIKQNLEKAIAKKAKKVLALKKKGINILFPDVDAIYKKLTK